MNQYLSNNHLTKSKKIFKLYIKLKFQKLSHDPLTETDYENLQLNEEIDTVRSLYVLVLNLSYHKISYSY